MSNAAVTHYSLNICKVKVYYSFLADQVGNTLDTLSEHLISHIESLEECRIGVRYLKQFIIRNYNYGVYILF